MLRNFIQIQHVIPIILNKIGGDLFYFVLIKGEDVAVKILNGFTVFIYVPAYAFHHHIVIVEYEFCVFERKSSHRNMLQKVNDVLFAF